MQPDRFSGGNQVTLTQIWPLPAARCRFGKYLRVAVGPTPPNVRRLLHEYPPQTEETEHGLLERGLSVRLAVERRGQDAEGRPIGAIAQFELPETARTWPTDEALAAWRAEASEGQATVVYE